MSKSNCKTMYRNDSENHLGKLYNIMMKLGYIVNYVNIVT